MNPDEMSRRRSGILREMGLAPLWKLRSEVQSAPVSLAQPKSSAVETSLPTAVDQRAGAIAAMGWEELRASVAACRACELCQARKQAVLGVGDLSPDWLFVGEGPGAEEDQRGEPFVGQAGKLLDAMLAAIGLQRGRNVYIANTVKCRPPANRTPTPAETAACWPYLERQIALLKPKLIVALGKPAAQTLLQKEVKVGEARGRLFEHNGIPLIVTYHPAYLLRTLQDKAKAWEDLCFARASMRKLQV
ncbi:MAG: uracil-DNA glycosylase [Sterolibacterium sp.]|nr:uracil-DNA glycosylase [Sterolibacterium sp.]